MSKILTLSNKTIKPSHEASSTWKKGKLGHLITLESGQHLNPDEYSLSQETNALPYFTGPTDFTNEERDLTKWTTKGKKFGTLNSILITVKGSGVGSVYFLKLAKVAIGRQLMSISAKDSSSVRFLYHLIQTKQEQLVKLATGNLIPGLTRDDILSLEVQEPSTDEQNKIGRLLDAWDSAIDKTQKLIDQIKLRNKGLAQQLLTGKKRLKGFEGEWKKVSVGDVTENFSRRNNTLVDARIYSVTNSRGFVFQSDHFSREVAGEDLRSYKIIRKGEFAYNPARINVGSIAYFSEDVGIISSLYVCFRTNDLVEDEFLYYWLSLDKTKHDFETFGEGGVRIYLWYELFAKIKVMLPSVQEQRAIVALLRSAAEELSRHEERLLQLKDQKKGLMQKLLTGEIRVKSAR